MLDILIDKIRNYKDPSTLPVNQGTYYVEFENNASYLVCPKSVVAFLDNGKVLRLANKCNEFEWQLHCDLYDLVSRKDDCRIEIPVNRTAIDIDGFGYHYFEVQRPNNELGLHFVDELGNGTITEEYFEEYIHDTAVILNHLKTLCVEHKYLFVPRELLSPYKRNKDSIGYFWIDFKTWDFPPYKFIEKKLRTLYLTLLTVNKDFDYNQLMSTAEKEWKFFYE